VRRVVLVFVIGLTSYCLLNITYFSLNVIIIEFENSVTVKNTEI